MTPRSWLVGWGGGGQQHSGVTVDMLPHNA